MIPLIDTPPVSSGKFPRPVTVHLCILKDSLPVAVICIHGEKICAWIKFGSIDRLASEGILSEFEHRPLGGVYNEYAYEQDNDEFRLDYYQGAINHQMAF